MNNHKFQKAARARHFKAFVLTAIFHLALFGSIFYASGDSTDFSAYVPEKVKAFFDKTESVETVEVVVP